MRIICFVFSIIGSIFHEDFRIFINEPCKVMSSSECTNIITWMSKYMYRLIFLTLFKNCNYSMSVIFLGNLERRMKFRSPSTASVTWPVDLISVELPTNYKILFCKVKKEALMFPSKFLRTIHMHLLYITFILWYIDCWQYNYGELSTFDDFVTDSTLHSSVGNMV